MLVVDLRLGTIVIRFVWLIIFAPTNIICHTFLVIRM